MEEEEDKHSRGQGNLVGNPGLWEPFEDHPVLKMMSGQGPRRRLGGFSGSQPGSHGLHCHGGWAV